MSLSNPNKVVTEERLNEYHNIILPYLGGMPDVLANKFSRADLYSTDEKMIGRWIDGKPLYQKTFSGGTSKTDGNVYDCSDLSIDTLVNIGGIFASGFDVNCYYSSNLWISSRVADGYIKTTCASTWDNLPIIVTIQYTKTTD